MQRVGRIVAQSIYGVDDSVIIAEYAQIMDKPINTVRDLIQRLGGGGRNSVANVTTALTVVSGRSLHVDTVYRWQNEDRVSAPWRDVISAIASYRGLALPSALRAPKLESPEAGET